MCVSSPQQNFGIQHFGFKMHIREKLQGVVVCIDTGDNIIVHRVPISLSCIPHVSAATALGVVVTNGWEELNASLCQF